MAMVVRVRFKRASKLYDFDPNGLELHNGTRVVTQTVRGVELGECVSGVIEMPDERIVQPLKPIIRIATEQDIAAQRRNEQNEREAFDIALDRIAAHGLEMKLVDVEYAFDRSKIIFYFTANGRVDFRMLVKNLAGIFKTRIELRQIGVRDEAKLLGGVGPCGRPICCRTYLSDFTPVSIKMAKEQNLSLNPVKISGLCDRLMCCLKYEQEQYETTRKRMPRVGREIQTPDGIGVINAINVLEETVRVRIAVGDSFELRQYKIDECQRVNQAAPAAGARQEERGRRGAARGAKPHGDAETVEETEQNRKVMEEEEAPGEIDVIGEEEAPDEIDVIGEGEDSGEIDVIGESEDSDEIDVIGEEEEPDEIDEIGESEDLDGIDVIGEEEDSDEIDVIGEAEETEEADGADVFEEAEGTDEIDVFEEVEEAGNGAGMEDGTDEAADETGAPVEAERIEIIIENPEQSESVDFIGSEVEMAGESTGEEFGFDEKTESAEDAESMEEEEFQKVDVIKEQGENAQEEDGNAGALSSAPVDLLSETDGEE